MCSREGLLGVSLIFNLCVAVWCPSCGVWGVCMPRRWPGCVRRCGVGLGVGWGSRLAVQGLGRRVSVHWTEKRSSRGLSVHDDHQPGPAVGCVRVPQLGNGPAESLLEQPEGVFDVEATQERLPAAGDIRLSNVHCGAPQLDRFRVTAAGQVINLEPVQVGHWGVAPDRREGCQVRERAPAAVVLG
jgi:hypothetical protein